MTDARFDPVNAAFKAYTDKVDAYVAAHEAFAASVDAKIAEAVAADDRDEDVDFAKLSADIDAAAAKMPAAPTV